MMLGDEFAATIPKWIRKLAKGCKCSSTQDHMNTLTAENAEKTWSSLEFRIYQSARKITFIAAMPRDLVIAAIRRRMSLAFRRAFGRSRKA